MDLHSNTGFSRGPATQYTGFFPYIDKLWFGESFMYDEMSPANWLVESSGIPFGLMGDMLYRGGNPWRGMVYGMTSRARWTGRDPRPIWKVWDDFGIIGSKMIGYWVPNNPVKTDNPNVLATVYKKDGKALVSLASWAAADTTIHLQIDWKALGMDAAKATITAPAVNEFQPAATFQKDEAIPVVKNKGWLLVIQ
jgi:hypothetical protein